jgi:predicted DNA-binding protein
MTSMTIPIKLNSDVEDNTDDLADFELAQAVMELVRRGDEKVIDAAQVRIALEFASIV